MKTKAIALLLALAAAVAPAGAANISFTGQFAYDNEVKLFQFTVDALTTVGIRTWSYAGGVNAAGQTIARGGFDPILQLFDAAGQLIGDQDDGGCAGASRVAADAVTRQCWDINYSVKLGPGTYTASLQQWNNYVVDEDLNQGFYYQDEQYRNFRNGFVDEMDNRRNGTWALDLLNVSLPPPAQLPEPASPWLVGAALVGMGALRRRARGAATAA